jgi:signal transduction histidine kinase/integral membrane sensor domain MASE1
VSGLRGWKPSLSTDFSLRTTALAGVVAVAYAIGAWIGFMLRFPPATPSVLWPPNSILTAALLLTPPRRWWIYLLAAFPAHFLLELRGGFPWSLVLVLFATNCSEALIAAMGVRRFSDAPVRFDTLRRATVFIIAAGLVAPFVSSFADAAAVAGLRGEPYWFVWQTRFFSNVLTELALVPALVMVITAGPAWVRGASTARRVEAAFLALGLLLIGLVIFGGPTEDPAPFPGAPLTFLLPLLLWAAVRFGPGGISLALLTTAALAIWSGTQGYGPFSALPPAQSVLAVQVFLIAVAVQLMCLAGVIEERRRAKEDLEERLRFEELLSSLSGSFVHLPSHRMDQVIEMWLRRLGEFLKLDRVSLLRLSDDQQRLTVACSWAAPGVEPAPAMFANGDFPWTIERLLGGQPFVVARLEDLPAEAALDKASLERMGIKSELEFPLVVGGGVFGSLAFVSMSGERAWPAELVQRLRLVEEVFANALARRQAEDALRTSETMKSAILASLTSMVAVLDREGRVIAVNRNTAQCTHGHGATWDAGIDMGVSYLDVCRHAAREGEPFAAEALGGIEEVLDGSRTGFSLAYPWSISGIERWFALSVVPLGRPEGGAVVSQTDITERKRAELEAQRSRQELAHFTRVSTIGELAASLAHELSQPLTAILTNAQAARRFLGATPPAIDELHGILSDIVDDDRRAGEVIRRLRELLRKGESQQSLLDLNAVVRDVARLVSNDAFIRNMAVALDLDPEAPVVRGDRVHLQQVVLNLVLNAMEAMGEGDGGNRTVVVLTRRQGQETARVSVEDAGTGLREGTHELIFEPFYTTKAAGMGMGLSIARSIVEAHGGLIWATNNRTHGATFHFTLPLAEEPSV